MINIHKIDTLIAGILIFITAGVAQDGGKEAAKLTTQADSLSYVIGRDVGIQLKKFGVQIRMSPFAAGVEQVLNDVESQIDSLKADSIRQAFAMEVQSRMDKEHLALSEKNKKDADEFLAQNRKKPGIQTTSSGLQYQVIEQGKGPAPTENDSVRVLYKGMLSDNTVFDSTVGNEPVVLDLQRTIPGLAEGIRLMRTGGRYRFFIPPDLAYGPGGIPPQIPPNAVLVFDIQLVGIGSGEKISRLKWNR